MGQISYIEENIPSEKINEGHLLGIYVKKESLMLGGSGFSFLFQIVSPEAEKLCLDMGGWRMALDDEFQELLITLANLPPQVSCAGIPGTDSVMHDSGNAGGP